MIVKQEKGESDSLNSRNMPVIEEHVIVGRKTCMIIILLLVVQNCDSQEEKGHESRKKGKRSMKQSWKKKEAMNKKRSMPVN